jgi:hypothetical protein
VGIIRDDAFVLEVDDGEVPVVVFDINRYQHEVVVLVKVCVSCPFQKAYRRSYLLKFGKPLGVNVVTSWETWVDLWGGGLVVVLSSPDLTVSP